MLGIHNDLVHHDFIDGYTGIVDLPEGATAAYGLRRLSSVYFGPALTVRRASDNATKAIKFNNFGTQVLDQATIESFCSGTDGFISIWNDQSGQSNDLVQTDTALQPQIVENGSVIKNSETGSFSIKFAGDCLATVNNLTVLDETITGYHGLAIFCGKLDSSVGTTATAFFENGTADGGSPKGLTAFLLGGSSIIVTSSGNALEGILTSSNTYNTHIFKSYLGGVALFGSVDDGSTTQYGLDLAALASEMNTVRLFVGSRSDVSEKFTGLMSEFICTINNPYRLQR